MKLAPLDDTITIPDLVADPYSIYARLRVQAPVTRVAAVGRTFITKAADTRHIKDTPSIFSSDDPNTPMKRAFRAQTLMRKDGDAHLRERMAMAPAFAPRVIQSVWMPIYTKVAETLIGNLPRGETVDLFPALAAPYAARGLASLLGIPEATDAEMIRWSQTLIDGAGNFGWADQPFEASDRTNDEVDTLLIHKAAILKSDPDDSALSAMVNADDPIPQSQIHANIKIAIGGGLNEPRDALLTALAGLLDDPEQRHAATGSEAWTAVFEEAIRWVAPIQVSSRLVLEDTELRGCAIPKGDTVMTIQASACHDEDLYDAPEKFDMTRPKQAHQAFGNGPHFCQGTHVARRMLANVMLPMLFDRFPKMVLAEPDGVPWTGFGFRGPARLNVTLN